MMKLAIITLALSSCFCCTINAQTLKEAIAKKDTVLAAKLIQQGANPNEKDENGTTLLIAACHFPDLVAADFLLRHGAKVDEPRTPKGRTPLMTACAYWCGVDMVTLLVKKGADVNAVSMDGSSALMLAASMEKLDVVNYLLEHGADANKKNAAGKTALDLATTGKVEDYMIKSIKDTSFDKDKVIAALIAAMKNK